MRGLLLTALLFLCVDAMATTGGVFGPVVNEDHQLWQYRIAYDEESQMFAQRLHYESAISGDLMWRGLVQARETQQRNVDFDFFQGELFWQLADMREGWQQGLRFDLRLRNDNRPHQVGLNWMHQLQLGSRWQARMLALTTRQFGDNPRSGIGLQTRASLAYRAADKHTVLLSLFSDYGSTADIRSGSDQSQQAGPTWVYRPGGGWQVLLGYLNGMTSGSPDHSVRFWITRAL